MTVLDLVKNDNLAAFSRYVDGNLWYTVSAQSESYQLEFPIPIEDTKGGVFHSTMKAITLMRWIRQHLQLIKSGENEDAFSMDWKAC